ncbi:MAG: hypothetical protein K0R02_383 [Rickettsiaceae bacterium]|jgi:hypothetical protein|nr:hypothetical protein [Rickettsiaceae bacterium]
MMNQNNANPFVNEEEILQETLNNSHVTQDSLKKDFVTAFKNTNSAIDDLASQQSTKDFNASSTIAELNNVISGLSSIVDIRNGVAHKKVQTKNGETFTVRDARAQSDFLKARRPSFAKDHPEKCPEAWIENMAGIARGAVKLGDITDEKGSNEYNKGVIKLLKKYKDEIHNLSANNSPEDLEKAYLKTINSFRNEMVEFVKQQNFSIEGNKFKDNKDIAQALNNTRNFANLEDEHHPIISISDKFDIDGQKTSVVTLARPISSPTDDLKKCYELNNPENKWVNELNPVNRKLVESYKDKILDGKHIISSQLSFIPGVRNSYLEYRGTVDNNGNLEKSSLTAEARVGTVAAYETKDSQERVRLTKINLLQLEHNLLEKGAGQVHLSLLNQVGEMAENPLSRKKGIPALVKLAADEINKPRGPNDKILISQAPVNIWAGIFKAKNFKLHAKNSLDAAKQGFTKRINVVSCKSGKDRTGLVCINNHINQIIEQRKDVIKNPIEAKRKIAEKIADTKHAQYLASSHGGTRGVHALLSGGVLGNFSGNPITDMGIDGKVSATKLGKQNKYAIEETKEDQQSIKKTNNKGFKSKIVSLLKQKEIREVAKQIAKPIDHFAEKQPEVPTVTIKNTPQPQISEHRKKNPNVIPKIIKPTPQIGRHRGGPSSTR